MPQTSKYSLIKKKKKKGKEGIIGGKKMMSMWQENKYILVHPKKVIRDKALTQKIKKMVQKKKSVVPFCVKVRGDS